jgi:DNA-binding NarL/FixJ family response regulator
MVAAACFPQTARTAIGAKAAVSVGEIRVLLFGLHGLLRDVIKDVLDRTPELTVVAEPSNPAEFPDVMQRTGAEVVVCGLDEATAEQVSARVLEPRARVKIVAIQDDGRRAVLWELRPNRREIGDLSIPVLVETVRHLIRS